MRSLNGTKEPWNRAHRANQQAKTAQDRDFARCHYAKENEMGKSMIPMNIRAAWKPLLFFFACRLLPVAALFAFVLMASLMLAVNGGWATCAVIVFGILVFLFYGVRETKDIESSMPLRWILLSPHSITTPRDVIWWDSVACACYIDSGPKLFGRRRLLVLFTRDKKAITLNVSAMRPDDVTLLLAWVRSKARLAEGVSNPVATGHG